MPARLLPLIVGPVILLPLAAYAYSRRQVRGASWYALLLVSIAVWSGVYALELAATDFTTKTLLLKIKYFGVTTLPLAWIGFILDFVATDAAFIRRVTRRMGVVALIVIAAAWTDQWHGLFWGPMVVERLDSISLLIGRGPIFWANVFYTYAALWSGVAVLILQAIRSPYLYRKRVVIVIAATVVPWLGNVVFMSRHEGPDNVDPTPYLFACTAVLAVIAIFRYRVLDPIPTLGDARIEVIGDGLIIADAAGRIADLNRAAESQIHQSRAGVAGVSLAEVLPGCPKLENRDARQDIVLPAAGGKRIYDVRITPIRSRDRLTGYVVLLTDVTERRQLEAELREAQKMEAIGKLAAGVAHDFNNLLTAIIGFATLAQEEAPPDSASSQWLSQIREAGEHAALVTRQLLAFGRKQLLQPVVLDLNRTIEDFQKMLRRLVGEDVRLVCHLAPDVPKVRADLSQIQQVLLNLAVNAREAMPGGGQLIISTALHVIDEPNASATELPPGAYATLAVRDTGRGIDDHVRTHIFEPFFTTKAFGQGSGLGLATVYGIVKQSGGDITVDTGPDRGTTFTVLLPAAADSERALPIAPPAGEPAVVGLTILLVEDDDGVRELAEDTLRGAGWTVISVASPADALAAAARESQPIDLLVTDVVMPGMSGGTLAEQITAIRPGLRVLFISGYAEEELMGRDGLAPGRDVLEKPFTTAELRGHVQRLVQLV